MSLQNTTSHEIKLFANHKIEFVLYKTLHCLRTAQVGVFTSSGPVRTTEVFATAISLSTAHSSVCLGLKKLTRGSGDWSICLQGQTNKDQWDGVSVCMCMWLHVSVYF